MNRITKEQVKILIENINKMAKSDEQFIFMVFKNPDKSDNITEYSFNTNQEKLIHYWNEAFKRASIFEEKSE